MSKIILNKKNKYIYKKNILKINCVADSPNTPAPTDCMST